MGYHIDTGLIKDKFKVDCECPLCEIEKVAEEQFLHEFLNDAVMEDNTRMLVNEKGFCDKHFDMLFTRQNKLSLALQMMTRLTTLNKTIVVEKTPKCAKKQAEKLKAQTSTCIICEYLDDSMEKYYKTVAELFNKEKSFRDSFNSSKGFCLNHYAKLLEYSSYAHGSAKEYINALTEIQRKNLDRLYGELKWFCDKHDYRNFDKPLGTSETALPRTRIKFYGKKPE